MTALLRGLAVTIAIVAAVDPALTLRRDQPAAVAVRVGQGSVDDPAAVQVRDRLARSVVAPAALAAGEPAAVVVVNPTREDLARLRDDIPLSFVETRPLATTRLAILRVEQPPAVLPGQTAVVRVHLQALGDERSRVVVALEQGGVVLAETTRPLVADGERFTVELAHAPPSAGLHSARVTARLDGMTGAAEPLSADMGLRVEARALRVLVFEPRPSWAMTFVRHALEADPAFEVAQLAQSSRAVAVRAGRAPGRLTADALGAFDAVLVGAPEALSEAEVRAIETFARVRGGGVILQPDRRPSGPYVRLLPPPGFEEVLLESPIALLAGADGMRASELALPRAVRPDVSTIASIEHRAGHRPVVFSWPVGLGRVVFSGALDAWRYRSDSGGLFARFWTGLAASLAAAAPRALEVDVDPSISAPGDAIRVLARVRGADALPGERVELPAVSAALIGEDGSRSFVRLWPAAEVGAFEGVVEAPAPGRFLVRVTAGTATAEVPAVVAEGLRQPREVDESLLERIAITTGGMLVGPADIDVLADRLRRSRAPALEAVHPMRSGWWLLAFAGSLCGEWALRRRRGLR